MPRRKEESDSEDEEEMSVKGKKSQKGNVSGDKLRWVNWVKKWAAENNMSYGCALSDVLCSGEYNEFYGIPRRKYHKRESDAGRTKRTRQFAGEKAIEKDRMNAAERKAHQQKVRDTTAGYEKAEKEHKIKRKKADERLGQAMIDAIWDFPELAYSKGQAPQTLAQRKELASIRKVLGNKKELKAAAQSDEMPTPYLGAFDRPKPSRRPAPVARPKGRGMTTMNTGEDTNGLSHIYPLTHGQILKIAAR
jgi:hypothetical protein